MLHALRFLRAPCSFFEALRRQLRNSSGFWPPSCLSGAERRTVPCISLQHVIESWLSGQEVYFLKIDAQGYDMKVVQSAGPMLPKVQNIELEGACDNAPRLYPGAPNCSTIWNFMNRAGYSCLLMHDVRHPEDRQSCQWSGKSFCQTCPHEVGCCKP